MKTLTVILAGHLDKALAATSPTLAKSGQVRKLQLAEYLYRVVKMTRYNRDHDVVALLPLAARQDAAVVKLLAEADRTETEDLVDFLHGSASRIYTVSRGQS